MSKYLLSEKSKRGLIRIINIQNDRTLLVESEDITQDIIHVRFLLDLESYPLPSLQEDYTRIGLELFSVEPYLVVEDDDDLSELRKEEEDKLKKEGVRLYD